jgi:CBS domain-containing protein
MDELTTPTTPRVQLRRTLVRDVMTTEVVSVAPDNEFDEVARILRENAVRAVPVLDAQHRLLGVVSEADLMGVTALGDPTRPAQRGRWHRGGGAWTRPRNARELMSAPVVSVDPSASVAEAARVMHRRKLGWLAVVEPTDQDADQLVGVLGRSDLLKVFLRDDEELRSEIVNGLLSLLLVDSAQVKITVTHGVVRLAGHLPTRAEARLVTEFVERLEGVVAVIHGLTYDVDDRIANACVHPMY